MQHDSCSCRNPVLVVMNLQFEENEEEDTKKIAKNKLTVRPAVWYSYRLLRRQMLDHQSPSTALKKLPQRFPIPKIMRTQMSNLRNLSFRWLAGPSLQQIVTNSTAHRPPCSPEYELLASVRRKSLQQTQMNIIVWPCLVLPETDET